ncbi:MAG: pyrroline-5-carboxylate reductase, partial [Clostridia bacterium]
MNNEKIGFIGTGNMATALINGIIRSGKNASDLIIYDIDDEKTEKFIELGLTKAISIADLSKNADIVFFTIKPQVFDDVVPMIVSDINKLYVSIAAGISISYLQNNLGEDTQIVRVMPNTPLLIGKGATAISYSSKVSNAHKNAIEDIFNNLGVTAILSEDKMNEIISVNGSSPAYIYYFADLVIKKATEMGIDESVAKTLFCNTLIGSAQMILDSKDSPKELIDKVTSKGGTTIKAMEVFYNNNLEKIVS